MARPSVVNVSGHMTDSADRDAPRFPESEEPRVTRQIRRVFDDWDVGPGTMIISGGARGTDLIAAEQALDLGADVWLCLAHPPIEFVEHSVSLAGTAWADRFEIVRSAASMVDVVPDAWRARSADVYSATNAWMIELGRAPARHGHETRVLIVWDGRTGDGPGGTRDFCLQLGVTAPDSERVAVIDPTPRRYEHRQPATPTPKRILALDGAGIRGVASLQILEEIERQLRHHLDDPKLRLVDYFDYIGGTSSGAILATALALGDHSVSALFELYEQLSSAVFSRHRLLRRLRSVYRHGPLEGQLGAIIGDDRTLGDPGFGSLLLLVLHNATTDSVWPLTNSTAATFNRADRYLLAHPDRNLDLALNRLVRGSTATPAYFAPERIDLGGREMVFQDGGITPFNNPAFLMYLLATSPAYGLEWRSGADELLVVSVGTRSSAAGHPDSKTGKVDAFFDLVNRPRILIDGGSARQDQICRTVGRSRFGPSTDRELGVRIDDRDDAAFTYVRYEADLSDPALIAGGCTSPRQRRRIRRLDAVDQVEQLGRVGRIAATNVDVGAHFAGFLERLAD